MFVEKKLQARIDQNLISLSTSLLTVFIINGRWWCFPIVGYDVGWDGDEEFLIYRTWKLENFSSFDFSRSFPLEQSASHELHHSRLSSSYLLIVIPCFFHLWNHFLSTLSAQVTSLSVMTVDFQASFLWSSLTQVRTYGKLFFCFSLSELCLLHFSGVLYIHRVSFL